jgi:hypothetical protein
VCHRHISWKMCLPLGPGTLYKVFREERPVKPSDRPLVCSTLKIKTWRATEVLRIQNLTKSSQAMSIPRIAGEAAEATFRWKRSTFEWGLGYCEKNCSSEFVKCRVFQVQEALFEGCTFPMWPPCRPQTKKTGRRKLENRNVALSQGEVVFGQ